ncbi:MAG: CotH kinase family protein [Planctomycetes bacterium]|nr:CotH kinase family protein [Planctomycetota bacterium]
MLHHGPWFLLRAVLLATAALAAAPAQQAEPPRDPAAAFFAGAPIVAVQILLSDAARASLKHDARAYVEADLRLDGKPFAKVGVKLKGAAGSFRELDDRPGFTVHLAKFGGKERFHGLRRFHLNNGAQDDSRLCEWVGHEVFTAAGLPAPRVAHARVRLGDQELGLYVFRESFDGGFLRRVFDTEQGWLYDGGFCQDVDAELEQDAGEAKPDLGPLQALAELCRGIDTGRAAKLAAAIDVAHFVDFMALEAMLGHWDGYCGNANNYRLWLPSRGKAVFLPHGMDQLFGDSEASVLDHPTALVASAMQQQPVYRKRYRERLRVHLPLFAPDRLQPKLAAIGSKLEAALRATDPGPADSLAAAVRDLQERIAARYTSLHAQVAAPEPKPLPLPFGSPLALKKWHPAAETEGIELEPERLQGLAVLRAKIGARSDEARRGAFRTTVLLGPGRYELRGNVRCSDVVAPPKDDDGNEHGGVRLCAGDARSERRLGSTGWEAMVCAFEVGEFQRTIELACELHGMTGTAWFRLDTLQLVRVGR